MRPSEYLRGTGEGTTTITEGGVRLVVDFSHGQKTGFYLDQRMNRGIIARMSAGRSVLNLFCYTGAVALRAVAAGATSVTSVDSSRRALEIAEESVLLEPFARRSCVRMDPGRCILLPRGSGVYDIVVADPPPFARRRVELEGALKGYLSLFRAMPSQALSRRLRVLLLLFRSSRPSAFPAGGERGGPEVRQACPAHP